MSERNEIRSFPEVGHKNNEMKSMPHGLHLKSTTTRNYILEVRQ